MFNSFSIDNLPDAFLSAMRSRWPDAVKLREPLSRHSTFGVGGPADLWLAAKTESDIIDVMALARSYHIPTLVIGNGTNILFSDAGFRGAVVKVSLESWDIQPNDDQETARLTADAGVNLPALVNLLAAEGWAGLEWGAGVPGSIGGAVVSNAGCHGACIADTIQSARIMQLRENSAPIVLETPAKELELGYRRSKFRSRREIAFTSDSIPIPPEPELVDPAEIIISAQFLLRKTDPKLLHNTVQEYRQRRKDTQPVQGSAGSVFKNPPKEYAGRLIEAAGLKGYCIGGAALSEKHANFIVNMGGATAHDIIGLIALARKTVLDRFGIALELEIELRGQWAD